jgi:hypothetical protein
MGVMLISQGICEFFTRFFLVFYPWYVGGADVWFVNVGRSLLLRSEELVAVGEHEQGLLDIPPSIFCVYSPPPAPFRLSLDTLPPPFFVSSFRPLPSPIPIPRIWSR